MTTLSNKAIAAKVKTLQDIIAQAEPAKRRSAGVKTPWEQDELAVLASVRQAVVGGAKMTELLRQVHAGGHLPKRGLAESFITYREIYSTGSKHYKGDKSA